MTRIEDRMKNYVSSYPQIKEKIMTAKELSEFMIDTLKKYPDEPIDELEEYCHGKVPESILSLMSLYKCKGEYTEGAIQERKENLSQFFTYQLESGYFPNGFDVSVMKVFRYMPVQWHSNEYFTVCYCVNGECPILFEDESIMLHSGNIVILAPNTIYASPCYHDESILIYYTIRVTTFYDVFWDNLSDVPLISDFFRMALQGEHGNPYLLFDSDVNDNIDQVLYQIYVEFTEKKEYSAHMINGLMNVFFVILLRKYCGNVILAKNCGFRWKKEYLDILNYIQYHFNYISMSDLKQRFNYCERQLNRIIQSNTGKTFTVILWELRMKKAIMLLKNKSVSIKQIAESVGYHNLNAFYKAFVKYAGIPPAEWRKTESSKIEGEIQY